MNVPLFDLKSGQKLRPTLAVRTLALLRHRLGHGPQDRPGLPGVQRPATARDQIARRARGHVRRTIRQPGFGRRGQRPLAGRPERRDQPVVPDHVGRRRQSGSQSGESRHRHASARSIRPSFALLDGLQLRGLLQREGERRDRSARHPEHRDVLRAGPDGAVQVRRAGTGDQHTSRACSIRT